MIPAATDYAKFLSQFRLFIVGLHFTLIIFQLYHCNNFVYIFISVL